MVYEGLLTEKEARDCFEKYGFSGHMQVYFANGEAHRAEPRVAIATVGDEDREVPGWKIGSDFYVSTLGSDDIATWEIMTGAGALGFAPLLGFPLPMKLAPRDGRKVILHEAHGPQASFVATWNEGRWVLDWNPSVVIHLKLSGWSPIVRLT